MLERMYDTDVAVLDALYANTSVIVLLLANSIDLLPRLASFLSGQKASRSVLRTHLSFFRNDFVHAHPEYTAHVALTLVFPNALFSKPRSKTAAAVWEVVGKSQLGADGLFKGTREAIDKHSDSLTETNAAIAKLLAGMSKRVSIG